MASLWERVRALEGRTLPTVSKREAFFEVAEVGDGYVRVVPRSSGKPRRMERREFEQAEALGLATTDVAPIQLREAGVSEFNPAYVAAMLQAAVGQGSTRS